MKMENEIKIVEPDYKKIRELSRRIDCMVTIADFNTSHPNPYRISYIAGDINRYLSYTGGRAYGIKY